MKKSLIIILTFFFLIPIIAQDLPKDVAQVFKKAEKLKNKEEFDQAIAAYKEVLRSVEHVESLESVAIIQMELRKQPNYREAYEFFDRAIKELERQISVSTNNKEKLKLGKHRDILIPKRNKAKSYVDQFDSIRGHN